MNDLLRVHPVLNHHKLIKELCEPLQKLNISYFSHAHIDQQGRFSVICNNPEFIELYYQKEYFNVDLHTADVDKFGPFVIWDNVPRGGKTLQMGEDAANLNIIHTFSIIKRENDGSHFYHFSTHIPNNAMNQCYLANLDLLNMFINYFNNEVKQSTNLSRALNLKVEVNQKEEGYTIQDDLNFPSIQERNLFLTLLKARRNDLMNLTQREIDCLRVYARGKTAKEVGNVLGISRRTVEHHLLIAKQKLQIFSKSQLMEHVMGNNLFFNV